jgi:hypothetical protein
VLRSKPHLAELAASQLGHSSYDVRLRAVEVCSLQNFGRIDLLRFHLRGDVWQGRANAAIALAAQTKTVARSEVVLVDLKEALSRETNLEASRWLIVAITRVGSPESLRVLEEMELEAQGELDDERRRAIMYLRDLLGESGQTSITG